MSKRRVAVLGCTGSVGSQTLSLLAEQQQRFVPALLSAHTSAAALQQAAADLRPAAVCLTGSDAPPAAPPGVRSFAGPSGLLAALDAAEPDLVLNAITGAAGLAASEWTLRHGRTLALANKESLVVAGEYLMGLAAASGARILPVDSEHCAIFQCLAGQPHRAVRRVWLTGSGGPFRNRPYATFDSITPAEALRHPTWSMGPRITVGSATMMNKAFEVLEAHWLFGFGAEQIEIVVHPQSIVHSLVEFVDGSMLAQCGVPDMRVPVQFCLGYPERLPFGFEPFDLARWRTLEFLPVDRQRFPAIGLGYQVLAMGGDAGALWNAADEVATAAFLAGRIPLPAIPAICAEVLRRRPARPIGSLQDALLADGEGRRLAGACLADRDSDAARVF